jgi:hypothetical protein
MVKRDKNKIKKLDGDFNLTKKKTKLKKKRIKQIKKGKPDNKFKKP